MFKSYLLLLLLFISVLLKAQTPEKINYQAVARDLDGAPLSGETVSIQFDIIQASVVVYSETQTLTTNQFGLFTAAIGGGTVVSGMFSAISWGNSATALQVTVNGDVMPSTQLLSVPYALYSKESLNGPMGAQGPIGIGINWLGTLSTIPSPANLNDAYYSATDGKSYIYDGAAWQVMAQDGSANGDGWGAVVVNTSGANISGNGTASNPIMVIDNDTSKTNELQDLSFNTSDQNVIEISNGSGISLSSVTPSVNQVLTWDGFQWTAQAPATLWTEGSGVMYPTTLSNKVGFGLTVPTAQFEVLAPAGLADNIVKIGETGTTNKLKMSSGTTAYTFGGGDGSIIRHDITVNHATGNVGVGLGTLLVPAAKFHLKGTLRLENLGGPVPVASEVLTYDPVTSTAQWKTPTPSPWAITGGAIHPATLANNVGIGTISPSPSGNLTVESQASKFIVLDLSGGSGIVLAGSWSSTTLNPQVRYKGISAGYFDIGQDATGSFVIEGNDTPHLTVMQVGNVGIGTTTPSEKLDVDGNIKLRGSNREINKTETGTANLLPIAYGNIKNDGTINVGTGNFTCVWTGTQYEITITGENYFWESYMTMITPHAGSGAVTAVTASVSSKLIVKILNGTGSSIAGRGFQFIVYKP